MKIEIIEVNYRPEEGTLTLDELGFKVGDVVETSGVDCFGRMLIKVVRETEVARVGNVVYVNKFEYREVG